MQLLTELLRSATPDQARRWLHTLLRVPEAEREELVRAMEERVLERYGELRATQVAHEGFRVHHPPEQKDGYVEQRIVEYGQVPAEKAEKKTGKRRKQG